MDRLATAGVEPSDENVLAFCKAAAKHERETWTNINLIVGAMATVEGKYRSLTHEELYNSPAAKTIEATAYNYFVSGL